MSATSGPSRNRQIIFSIFALVVIPVVLLFVLEMALRLVGFGYPTSFFLEQKERGEVYLVQNDRFAWRFFPPELARTPPPFHFRKKKDPGTIRIFLFGESAALGDPKPAFSMGRYLEVLLNERYPGKKFEVISSAMTAINSHALVQVAKEVRKLEGDYWIIYMGNNEMPGPFGANPITGLAAPSTTTVKALLAIEATRTGQLMERLASLALRKKGEQSWEGMKMFTEHRVNPGAPVKEKVYRNFQENLAQMVQFGEKSGARVLVCTVASNLKDCAPFVSVHRDGLTAQDQQAWSGAFTRGKELQATNDFPGAIAEYTKAAAADAEFAETYFRLGTSFSRESGGTNALTNFEKARDLDALPFRTDSRANDLIRKTAGTNAFEVAQALIEQSGGEALGQEIFYDHVHFNFGGNYRVARLLAARLEEGYLTGLAAGRSITWAALQACDQRLACTDWDRRSAAEQMLRRISEPPFTERANQDEAVRGLAQTVLDLRKKTIPAAVDDARAVYEEALRKEPADFYLHENYAEFLESIGRLSDAAAQWEAVAGIIPDYFAAYYQAGRLFSRASVYDRAEQDLLHALKLRPDLAELEVELGLLRYRQGRPAEALQVYEKVQKRRPHDPKLMVNMADAFAANHQRDKALEALRTAIEISPDFWEPHYLLGIEYASQNRLPDAVREFQTVVRLRPDFAQGHFNLGVALAKGGQLGPAAAEFERTVQLDPAHKSAAAYLAQLQKGAAK